MIRPFKQIWPKLGERVYVDPSAQVIGDVELGDHSSVWMNAVIRGRVVPTIWERASWEMCWSSRR